MASRAPIPGRAAPANRPAAPSRGATHWSGLGINYSAASMAEVDSNMPLLCTYFSRLRAQYPLFTANTTLQQHICTVAKAAGMYIIWGITTPNPCDLGTWTLFKVAVANMAATAQSLGIDQFSVGNECELHADGSTLTASTVRSDVRALAATVKGSFGGKVSYEADQSQSSAWASEGIGALDCIGFNIYSNYPTHIANMQLIGLGKSYISEFNLQSGYFAVNNEAIFTNVIADRLALIRSKNIQSAYFYNWQYDTPYQWALHLPNGTYRQVLYPLTNSRAP